MNFERVKLSSLFPASMAPKSLGIHIRRSSGEVGMDELVASIRTEGLQHPLKTYRLNGDLYVVAGNRRLEALKLLSKQDVGDYDLVDVEIYDDVFEARAAAHATNVSLQLHEVDLYEHVAEFIGRKGATAEDAQARFALTPKRYAQVMRLAGLSPVVRSAWRDGEIGADVAIAFTLSPSTAEQEKIFASLKRQGGLNNDWSVRSRIVTGRRDLGPLMQFVGLDALREADVKLNEDLFGTDHTLARPADEKKLRDMVWEKVEAEKKRLVEDEGWGWAERREEVPDSYTYESAPSKNGRYAVEVKKASGCFLSINGDGQLVVEPGKVRPQERKKVARATDPDAKEPPRPTAPVVSESLMLRLSTALENAVADTLRNYPLLACRALVASFGSHLGPLSARTGQVADGTSFADLMTAVADKTEAQVLDMLSIASSAAVKVASPRFDLARDENLLALIELLPAERFNEKMAEHFMAEDFFSSIRQSAVAGFVDELLGADARDRVAKMKKADAVTYVVDVMKGWLPPQIRTVHYAGPSAKRKPAAKASARRPKAAKKRAAKRRPAKRSA